MDANDKRINVIFNATDESTVYKIPAYQREYVWEEKNWDFFINDIKDSEIINGESHFLGSIIVIKSENSSYTEVVDGQQRLTTIALAFVALRKATEGREAEKFEDMRVYSRDFVVIKTTKTPRLIPSEQQNDSKNFNLLLQELKLIPHTLNSNIDKNSNIYKAYAYFLSAFSSLTDDELNKFYSKLITTVLIEISVTDYRSANRLFESLNNRGQELTPMDLIKNMIFSQIESEKISLSIERWNKIITYVQDAKTQERFLRHYHNAFSYKEEINVLKKKKITKSKIIDAFEKILKNDNSQKLFDDLYQKSQIYGVFEASDTISNLGLTDCSSQKSLELKDNLFELKKIGATPAYTYLLYLFTKNINNEGISVSDLIDITNVLKKYSIRRSLTNTPPTNALDDIYINLVEKTEEYLIDLELQKEYKLKDIIIGTLQQNVKKYASNNSILEELKGDIYIEHKDLVKVLLIMYENYKVALKEKKRDLWDNVMN